MEVDGAPAESSADASKAQARAEAEAAVEEEASKAVAEFKGRPTGRYELRAVLTHKGRSADSGHYVAWCKQDDGKWVLYDDDQLTVKTEEEILALSGGGDWHMAYLLLYQAQKVPMEV